MWNATSKPGLTRVLTRVNTNMGRTQVSFSHAGQLVAFPGEVLYYVIKSIVLYILVDVRVKHDHKTHDVRMCKIKTNPGSTQVCVYTTLFQTNPDSTQVEPTSRGGLSPVYTAQTNPGSTQLCSHKTNTKNTCKHKPGANPG